MTIFTARDRRGGFNREHIPSRRSGKTFRKGIHEEASGCFFNMFLDFGIYILRFMLSFGDYLSKLIGETSNEKGSRLKRQLII